MTVKVAINFGFVKIEFDMDCTDGQRENWARLLSALTDYRVLSAMGSAEYVPEVMASVVRLRKDVLPSAIKELSADDPLRKSYEEMRRAVRDFLTSVRNVDPAVLTNATTNLSQIQPVGYQWTFVSALQAMRDVFVKEITENCAIFGLEMPEQFQGGYHLPEPIAEEWAEEVAALFDGRRS
jgi:hypothetical protein